MATKVSFTESPRHTMYGTIEWFPEAGIVEISWDYESWHNYPGAPGIETFNERRSEKYYINPDGSVTLPDGYKVEE